MNLFSEKPRRNYLSLIAIGILIMLFSLAARGRTLPRADPLITRDEFDSACASGDLEAIKKLIAHKHYKYYDSASTRPRERQTLSMAAKNGHAEVCDFLISEGANIDLSAINGGNPLFYATRGGHTDTVKILLRQGAKVDYRNSTGDYTALHVASLTGNTEIASLLLDAGADIEAPLFSSLDTPIHLAAENGHDSVLKLLIERGADVNAKTKYNFTPLLFAAINGHREACALLMARGAETDIFSEAALGRVDQFKKILNEHPEWKEARIYSDRDIPDFPAPIHFAAEAGKLDILKMLAQNGVNPCPEFDEAGVPLFFAAKNGHYKVVKYLLDQGASPNAMARNNFSAPLEAAVRSGHLNTARLLLEKGAEVNSHVNMGPTPFQIAARKSDRKMCLLLIAHGANINYGGVYDRTPLHEAPDAEIARLLIKHGADIDARETFRGCSPLWFATSRGRTDVVKLLLDKGADINQSCEGHNPLQIAAGDGRKDICELLLSKGVDINQTNNDPGWPTTGYTPLHLAAMGGRTEVVALLISKGADINAKSINGETPLAVASDHHNYFCEEVIRKHGGIE